MLIVTNFKGTQTEPFFTTSAPIFEQDNLGNLSLEFTVNKSNNEAGFNLLQDESVVTAANYRFRVKQINDDKPGRKTILAISTFFDMSYSFKSSTLGGTHTINEFLTYLFASTGWAVTCDFSDTATIGKFGSKNIIQCVNQVCDAFNCEFEILPNNRVHFSKSLGPDNGAQYRFGHNIKALSRKVDTTQLRTQITATGKDDLTVTYTSPNHTMWGIRVADPISDERFTDANNLMKKAKDSIIDYPEVSFELDTIELLDKALGEKVWLIYEPIEGLELQTRILQRTCIVDELTDELKTITVKLGNSLPRTLSDNEVDIVETIEDTKEEISEVITETKKDLTTNIETAKSEFRSAITQTEQRITLEVEQLNTSIARIDIKADNINLSVNNRITNEVAQIDIRANQIALNVANLESNTSSSINILQNRISLKVDANGIISAINMSPEQIDIMASRINLRGSVTVMSEITDKLGTIRAGDIYGINIHSANINISENIKIGRSVSFADMTSISGSGGTITIDAFNDVIYQGLNHYFYGTVNFSYAKVIGLPKTA